MRILLIGGNGFIGSPLVRELLVEGHQVAVFHRTADAGANPEVVRIQGDRNRLSDFRMQIQRFSPDVIVDLILSSGEQARQLMSAARNLARRVVAISSMDVYRAWGVLQGNEPGPLEPLPLTEESPLRSVRQPYPPETVKMLRHIFTWFDENYDKIAVEEAIMSSSEVPGTVLRLPMVHGPGDPLHRFFPLLKRVADGRACVLLAEDIADWRGPKGYVENVAHAIALAATLDQAAGRVYNVNGVSLAGEHCGSDAMAGKIRCFAEGANAKAPSADWQYCAACCRQFQPYSIRARLPGASRCRRGNTANDRLGAGEPARLHRSSAIRLRCRRQGAHQRELIPCPQVAKR
jgi:nucleoside-diphosphate-sugar epimerase